MTARIKREFNFIAGIWLHDEYQIGMYSFTLFIEILTDDPYEQSVALERMKYFIDEVVTNSVFIEASDKKAIDTFTGLGMKVGVLPLDPYDQSLAIALLLKMNAITEDKMNITHITFKSQLSDETFDTIGGLVLSHFGYLPKRDEEIVIALFRFRILSSDTRQIMLLQLEIQEPASEIED